MSLADPSMTGAYRPVLGHHTQPHVFNVNSRILLPAAAFIKGEYASGILWYNRSDLGAGDTWVPMEWVSYLVII
jgi:hypothetical protein